jgi:hypothetical protein
MCEFYRDGRDYHPGFRHEVWFWEDGQLDAFCQSHELTWKSEDFDPWTRTTSGRHEPVWRVNPANLRSMEFYKALDAFTAHQELSMWIGGVLSGLARPMVAITDDRVKAAKHGFDEWSFRKPPSP